MTGDGVGRAQRAQPQPDDHRRSRGHIDPVVGSGLGPRPVRVDGVLPARHDIVVEPVLDIGRRVGRAEEPLVVGIVLGKKKRWRSVAIEPIVAEVRMRCGNRTRAWGRRRRPQRRLGPIRPPSSGVAKPQRRQRVQQRRFRPAVGHADLD